MKRDRLEIETNEISCARYRRGKLLITTYQEVKKILRSNTCCNDESVRVDRNIDLPEQHSFQ